MISAKEYAAQRSPRFGEKNPQRMEFEFWRQMVYSGQTAYAARREHGEDGMGGSPVWSFHRFGQTRSLLPDGTVVCVGGEHEDHYDPDFNIYNDVIVVSPAGEVTIYGYPEDDFPATDFHTATLCGDRIILIGRLGYAGRYGSDTPVYSLNLRTRKILRLWAGGDSPGWLYGHSAKLIEHGRAIEITGGRVMRPVGKAWDSFRNPDAFKLLLDPLRWERCHPSPDLDAVPQIEWPYQWTPIVKAGDADYAMNNLRHVAPVGHPLFACNVRPWADNIYDVLFKVLDGTPRVAQVRSGNSYEHAQLPEPRTVFFDTLADWIAAAEASD
jgi:hypothetical protein